VLVFSLFLLLLYIYFINININFYIYIIAPIIFITTVIITPRIIGTVHLIFDDPNICFRFSPEIFSCLAFFFDVSKETFGSKAEIKTKLPLTAETKFAGHENCSVLVSLH
jgi:hypothetical protein